MPQWNPEQLKAIQTRDHNILVCASAGSGKTTVLIARLMELVVKDRIPIDAILAMTFTEAAANEMKKRLAKSLNEAIIEAKNKNNQEDIQYLNQQLSSLQNASISTIHSFALSIVQKYYYMIGLSAERVNHILDSASVSLYKQNALEEAFQIQYRKQDPIFLELCDFFSARAEDETKLRDYIIKIEEMATAQPNSNQWLDSLKDAYTPKLSINDYDETILEPFYAFIQRMSQSYLKAIHQLHQYVKENEIYDDAKMLMIEDKLDAAKQMIDAIQQRNYPLFFQYFMYTIKQFLPDSPRSKKIMESIKEQLKLYRETIHDLEKDLLNYFYDEDTLLHDMNALYPYVEKLIEMTKDYRHAFAYQKYKAEGIDFDDMEHFALEILQCNNHEVANRLREKYQEIMVDEFQDTNAIQDSMVQLICRKNNVFRVGDVKQSIYGFRHARPDLMKSLIQHQSENDCVIYLNNNYRSKYSIVQFNNELFDILMNVYGFQPGFDQEDYAYIGIDAQKEDNRPIEFHLIDDKTIGEQLEIYGNPLKADYIANAIQNIREKENLQWKDFVVLVRKNKEMDYLKEVFLQYNIPFFIASKTGFYHSEAVSSLLSFLKALANPDDDIAYVATMISPFFQMNEQDFTKMALLKKAYNQNVNDEDKIYSYYQCHREVNDIHFQQFEQLRRFSYQADLEELLQHIFEQNNYYHIHCSLQEKTNLDLFFEQASQYEKQSGGGLHDFLVMMEEVSIQDSGEAIPIGSEADVVRVMSIHQSKGLQFKCVFLWSTLKLDAPEFINMGIVDSELGLGLRYNQLPERFVHPTLLRMAMQQKKLRENLEEEMRILYVATTRAQQQLHIVEFMSVIEDVNDTINAPLIYDYKNYTAWMMASLAKYRNEQFDSLMHYLNACNDNLFQFHLIHEPWATMTQIPQQQTQELPPVYQYSYTSTNFKAASDYKVKPVLHKNNEGMLYGTRMHKMVELLKGNTINDDTIYQKANELGIPFTAKDCDKIKRLFSHPLFQQWLLLDSQCELPYLVKINQEVIHGYIDFIAFDHTQKTIEIVDFKTDGFTTAQQFKNAYSQQLQTYQNAIQQLYPQYEIHTHIYSFHNNEMYTI